VLGGIGVGLAMPNLLAAATATLPPAQASTGGGIVSMARQVGLALGVSMLVTIVDGADREAGFTHAWYAVALGMLLGGAQRTSAVQSDGCEPRAGCGGCLTLVPDITLGGAGGSAQQAAGVLDPAFQDLQ